MADDRIRELERRYQASQASADLVAWLTERIRACDPSLSEAELLDHARRDKTSPGLRLALAGFLGVENEPCAAFLAAEDQLLAAPADPGAWERYHLARGRAPTAWLARLEQPSLLRSCPLPVEPVWVSTGIGDYRPVEGTYGASPIHAAPDLPLERVLDFAWLRGQSTPSRVRDPHAWRGEVQALEGAIDAAGVPRPASLLTLLREHVPRCGVITSSTDCYFTLGFRPVAALGGLVVPFYNDSQGCVTWGLWLHRGGAQAVVGFQLLYADPDEEAADLPPQVSEPLDEEGTRLGQFFLAETSLEAFLYRTWIENELWYGLHPGDWPARDLHDPELAAYLAHYR